MIKKNIKKTWGETNSSSVVRVKKGPHGVYVDDLVLLRRGRAEAAVGLVNAPGIATVAALSRHARVRRIRVYAERQSLGGHLPQVEGVPFHDFFICLRIFLEGPQCGLYAVQTHLLGLCVRKGEE